MKPIYLLFICLGSLLMFACSSSPSNTKDKESSDLLPEIYQLMSGRFSSEAQAKVDSDYYHISLVMYPIWEENEDAKWLYVEQAVASALDKPYRQRVYRLSMAGNGEVESRVYELPQPDSFVHAWNKREAFASLSPDSLILREGCSVYLKKKENCYEGSTNDGACKSSLRGASYATSTVTVCKEKLESWDQGWDDAGEQVWGAEKGGYVFDRIE